MQYVDFLGQKVSKIICGDNPFNGHSYIEYQTTGTEMKNFYPCRCLRWCSTRCWSHPC